MINKRIIYFFLMSFDTYSWVLRINFDIAMFGIFFLMLNLRHISVKLVGCGLYVWITMFLVHIIRMLIYKKNGETTNAQEGLLLCLQNDQASPDQWGAATSLSDDACMILGLAAVD